MYMYNRIHLLPPLLFLILLLATFAAADTGDYVPSESFLVNCGSSSDAADADGRKWSADDAFKFGVSTKNSTTAAATSQDPSLPSAVPYMTARVFTSESTYKFSVNKTARHWIRLHFYPSTYNGLIPENCFFAVSASGGVTLLRNFSAYITTKVLTQAYLVKEFSVMPSFDGSISLTFTPSDKYKGSYAFINEIISMPEIFSQPTKMVGYSDQSIDVGSSALQTVYRLNVGGGYIPATNDSGLSRTWYDDSPYIYGSGFGVTFSASDKLRIQYSDGTPQYLAPADVYQTARSMGPDNSINMNYNLTWILQVDGNFTYMSVSSK